MDEVCRRVQAALVKVAGEQGLLLDECGWEKSGTKSVGVGRQYIGQVDEISNEQVGVFAVLSWGTSAALMGVQLYLLQAWCAGAARYGQARVPLAARTYRSKPALVDQLLGQRLVRAEWVGGDAAYGSSPALRHVLQQRGRPTCSTWGRGYTSTRLIPPPPPRLGPDGAGPHAGRSPWARHRPCRSWRCRCKPVLGR